MRKRVLRSDTRKKFDNHPADPLGGAAAAVLATKVKVGDRIRISGRLYGLIQWWLVHRVPIDVLITSEIKAAACQRFKIPPAAWEEAKRRFPNLLLKVNQKRRRRIEYALATGMFPPAGWTPPDPKNRSTGNVAPYARFWKH